MDTMPKRRWGRFSLRTLFVVVSIACAGFGWLSYKVRQAQRQREMVAMIEKRGGWVKYDYQSRSGSFDSKARVPGPAWLRTLLGDDFFVNVDAASIPDSSTDGQVDDLVANLKSLPQIRRIYLGSATTDASLLKLKGLSRLQFLYLGGTRIGDAGLAHLEEFANLKHLYVQNTLITDASLVHLQKFSQLEELGLSETRVTNAGLIHLKELKQLKRLMLESTQVTDAGLVHLHELTRLEELFLTDTPITDAGLAQLLVV